MMMPGRRRRARLVADWTVGLLFGRDSSELGQLGHPPQLAGAGLAEQSSGGTAPDGSGRAEDAAVR
jgi:NADH dehydrogenase